MNCEEIQPLVDKMLRRIQVYGDWEHRRFAQGNYAAYKYYNAARHTMEEALEYIRIHTGCRENT